MPTWLASWTRWGKGYDAQFKDVFDAIRALMEPSAVEAKRGMLASVQAGWLNRTGKGYWCSPHRYYRVDEEEANYEDRDQASPSQDPFELWLSKANLILATARPGVFRRECSQTRITRQPDRFSSRFTSLSLCLFRLSFVVQ
jgi:hypothetical protein